MATTRLVTVEDLEQMDLGDGLYQLIDGRLVEMAPAGSTSSAIGLGFGAELRYYVRPRRLGKVYGADGGFVLATDPPLVLVPNAAFVRADRLPSEEEQERFLRLAPDLVVEVVSPTDRLDDVAAKAQRYLNHGVRLVWMAEPRRRVVTVYRPGEEPMEVGADGVLDGGDVLPGFRLPVRDVFL